MLGLRWAPTGLVPYARLGGRKMSDDLHAGDDTDEPMSLRTKLIAGVVAGVLLLAAAAFMMRAGSPAITPDQAPPAGHYGLSCGLCHTISADAAKADTK